MADILIKNVKCVVYDHICRAGFTAGHRRLVGQILAQLRITARCLFSTLLNEIHYYTVQHQVSVMRVVTGPGADSQALCRLVYINEQLSSHRASSDPTV